MFGYGHVWELVIVLVLALIFIGPGKLPQVGGAIGKTIREFRRASSEVEDTMKDETQATPPPALPTARGAAAPTQQAAAPQEQPRN